MPVDGGVCGKNAIEEMVEVKKGRVGIEFIESGCGAMYPA